MSELPEGWVKTTLSEVIQSYDTIDPHAQPDKNFRYIDIGSIDNGTHLITETKAFLGRDAPSRARRVVKCGDVLFSTVRTYLKNITVVPSDLDGVLTSTGIAVLRPSLAIQGMYLFNWVRSDVFVDSMSKAQDGTLYPAVRDSDVNSGEIPLPPLAEQTRIVAKLDTLTGATARARAELDRIPALIARYKQAILSAAFTGDLTREWRQERAIPEWETTKALNLFTWASGKFLPRKDQMPGSIPVYGGNGITGTHNVSLVGTETIVIGRVGAQCGNVHLTCGPAWVTDNAIYASKYSDRIDLNYALHVFREANLNERSGGTGQPYVNQEILNDVEFCLPTREEQSELIKRINTAFGWLDRMAAEREKAARLLPRLDQEILAKAFRGELVPQDPSDEPASALLERIRAERANAPKQKRQRKPRGETTIRAPREKAAMTKSRFDDDVKGKPYLAGLLREADSPVTAEELFKRSELPVADFYKQLAWEVDAGHIRDDEERLVAA